MGEDLHSRKILSEQEYNKLNADIERWDSYNVTMLKNMFTNDEITDEYGGLLASWQVNQSWTYWVDWKKNFVSDRINSLKAIQEKLELYQTQTEDLKKSSSKFDTVSRKVFIVHGRNNEAQQTISRFLEKLDLQPIILHEQPNKGKTIIEKFETYSDVSFAVVLLTPDDQGFQKNSSKEIRDRARQNVILELGFFLGRLGRSRVCPIYWEGVEIPSDYDGVVYVPFDEADGWKLKLAREIKQAGIDVDLNKAIG